jgi:hypothetical protein
VTRGALALTAGTALLLAACGGRPAPPMPVLSFEPTPAEADANAIVMDALRAESRIALADSLYGPDAVFIVDGRFQQGYPRMAGIVPDCQVSVTQSRSWSQGPTAWAVLDYQCLAPDRTAREGRATFILGRDRATGRWRILHIHSSTP